MWQPAILWPLSLIFCAVFVTASWNSRSRLVVVVTFVVLATFEDGAKMLIGGGAVDVEVSGPPPAWTPALPVPRPLPSVAPVVPVPPGY